MPQKRSAIFIGGVFKSGTSLLRAMLGQHSNLAAGLETYWFDLQWEERARSQRSLRNHEGRQWDASRDEPFGEHIERLRKFFDVKQEALEMIVDQSGSVTEFVDRFMSHYAQSQGKQRWIEKTPGNVLHLDKIFSAWPNAKFIHLIRDPKDVYASCKQAQKWDTPLEFAKLWGKFFKAVEDFKRTTAKSQNGFVEVHYEHLVLSPQDTMRPLVTDFLGEPWEEEVAQYAGRQVDYEKVLQLTGKASGTLDRMRNPLTNERIGIWRNIVSDEELARIREDVNCQGVAMAFEQAENWFNGLADSSGKESV